MSMKRKDSRPGSPAKSAAPKSAAAKFAPRAASGPPLWSVPLKVDAIPDGGLHRSIEASPETCAAVAKLAEVREVTGLKATFELSRAGDIVHVTGRVLVVKVGYELSRLDQTGSELMREHDRLKLEIGRAHV